jgi:hypothetical protein
MSVVGLYYVQVAAPRGCEAEARRFYGTLLGLVEVEKPESLRGRGGVWFRCGEQQLHVGVEDGFAPRARRTLLCASPPVNSTCLPTVCEMSASRWSGMRRRLDQALRDRGRRGRRRSQTSDWPGLPLDPVLFPESAIPALRSGNSPHVPAPGQAHRTAGKPVDDVMSPRLEPPRWPRRTMSDRSARTRSSRLRSRRSETMGFR